MIQTGVFWLFCLLTPLLYWRLPEPVRFRFTAVAFVAAIAYFDIVSAAILLAAAGTVHGAIRFAERDAPRRARAMTLVGCLVAGHLLIWKLAGAVETALATEAGLAALLPLGISYYSFKIIHVAIENARGRLRDYRPDIFLTYLFLPTAFSAGPIQRFDRFVTDLRPDFDLGHVRVGLTRIGTGLIKQFVVVGIVLEKFLLADLAGIDLAARHGEIGPGLTWYYLSVFYLTIYLNFSAYTDIAIGASRLFGFVLMENFNWPILATSIEDFWRRWHMTLSGWCRDYVFQPVLGLSRNPILAAYATFLVIGLWHAFTLNRLTWGLMHGTALIASVAVQRQMKKGRRGRSRRRHAGSAPLFSVATARTVTGWTATQVFLVVSMAALAVEGNDLAATIAIIAHLFMLT